MAVRQFGDTSGTLDKHHKGHDQTLTGVNGCLAGPSRMDLNMKARLLVIALTALATFEAGSASAATPTFSSAIATFQQTWDLNFNSSQMIDGNFTPNNGWAIYRGDNDPNPDRTLSETALLTMTTPLGAGAYSLNFTLYQYHGNPGHSLGDFSLGYVTSASPALSDVNTPLVITGASSLNGNDVHFSGDRSDYRGWASPKHRRLYHQRLCELGSLDNRVLLERV